MSRDIADDPSVVRPIFDELKRNFYDGCTRPVKFRKQALSRLLEGYIALEEEITAALKLDLGLNDYVANFGAHCITKAEIKDLLDGVSAWAKPQSVSTPVGTYDVTEVSVSPPAPLNTSRWELPWSFQLGTTPSTLLSLRLRLPFLPATA
jgi:hypothetical protein